jgi:hypothetical protein
MGFNQEQQKLHQNGQISEEELKAMFRPRELFSFAGHLARKGEPKSYLVQKKPTYLLNIVGFLSASLLRILAGFMAVSTFLTGVFFGSELAGGVAAAALLLALEYLQVRNATELYETWFYKSKILRARVVYCLLFSGVTASLAFMGVDDTVKVISETVSPFQFDEAAVNPVLRADIDRADADAAEFYKARSWRGKLDGRDTKRYQSLKDEANALRKQYREEVSTARLNAKGAYDNEVAGKNQDDADTYFYLLLLIGLTELLFPLAVYHKERYEFLAAKELEIMGKINHSTIPPPHSPQGAANQAAQPNERPAAANAASAPFQ